MGRMARGRGGILLPVCPVTVSYVVFFLFFLHMASTFFIMSFSRDGLDLQASNIIGPYNHLYCSRKPLHLLPFCMLYLSHYHCAPPQLCVSNLALSPHAWPHWLLVPFLSLPSSLDKHFFPSVLVTKGSSALGLTIYDTVTPISAHRGPP